MIHVYLRQFDITMFALPQRPACHQAPVGNEDQVAWVSFIREAASALKACWAGRF